MNVVLKNSAGQQREVKIGFSWTGLFFGPFVPMVRGDWKGFFIWLVVDIMTCGLGWFVFPFVYNKSYIKRLIENRGYLPATEEDKKQLNSNGITVEKIYGEAQPQAPTQSQGSFQPLVPTNSQAPAQPQGPFQPLVPTNSQEPEQPQDSEPPQQQ